MIKWYCDLGMGIKFFYVSLREMISGVDCKVGGSYCPVKKSSRFDVKRLLF